MKEHDFLRKLVRPALAALCALLLAPQVASATFVTEGGRAEAGGVECIFSRGYGTEKHEPRVSCLSRATMRTRPDHPARRVNGILRGCGSNGSSIELRARGTARAVETCNYFSYPGTRIKVLDRGGSVVFGALICTAKFGTWAEEQTEEEEYVVCRSRTSHHEFIVGPAAWGRS